MKFKKLTALMLTAILGIGALTSCSSGDETSSADADALTYVSLRINPEIELLADEEGTVVSANAVNEDGEILLTTVDFIGTDVEDAAAAFAESANELGYVTEGETDTVYIGVEGADSEEIKEKLDKGVRDYFKNNGINGKVSPETLDKYAERAEDWGLSMGHTKLVMRALDANPELTDEEVIKLSVKEIMLLIKGDKNEEKEDAKEHGISPGKYKVISAIIESNPKYTVDELRDKSMAELKELLPEESNKNDKNDKNDKNNKK